MNVQIPSDGSKTFWQKLEELHKHIGIQYTLFKDKRLYLSVVAWLCYGEQAAAPGFQNQEDNAVVPIYIHNMMNTFKNQPIDWNNIAWSLFFHCDFTNHDGSCSKKLKITKRIPWSPAWKLEAEEVFPRLKTHKLSCLKQLSNSPLPDVPDDSCIEIYGTKSDMFICLPDSMYHKRGLRYLTRNGLLHAVECHKDASVLFACKEWETGLTFIRKKIHEDKDYPMRTITWHQVEFPDCVPIRNKQLYCPEISERTIGTVALNSLPVHQSAILWWMRARECISPKEWLGVRINGYWFSPFIQEPAESPRGGVIACEPGLGIIVPILRLCQHGNTVVIAHPNLVQTWKDNDIQALTFEELVHVGTLNTNRLIIDVKEFTEDQLQLLSRISTNIIWWLSHSQVDITLAKRICRWDVKVSQRLTSETFILCRQLVLHMSPQVKKNKYFLRYIWCKPNLQERNAIENWNRQVSQLHTRKEIFTSSMKIEEKGLIDDHEYLNNFQRQSVDKTKLPIVECKGFTNERCPICHDQKDSHSFVCGHSFCFECCSKVTTCPLCRRHSPIIYEKSAKKVSTMIQTKIRKLNSWIKKKNKSNIVIIAPEDIQQLQGMPTDVEYSISGDGYTDKTLVYWSLPHTNEALYIPRSANNVYILILKNWVADFWMEHSRMNRSDMFKQWMKK